jgi:hypothetical protein
VAFAGEGYGITERELSHVRDAERWQLRAEEYRAIGTSTSLDSTRRSYDAMSEQCDRIANQTIAPQPGSLSANDCLAYAAQCEALAQRIAAKTERERIKDLAEQWRKLAQWGNTLR